MALKLSQIGATQRETVIGYDGESVAIVYRPGQFTPRVEARLNEAQDDGHVSQEVARVLSEVLVSWDVEDDDGQTLAPTVDLLMDLPISFLVAVSTGIGEDMAPKGPSA